MNKPLRILHLEDDPDYSDLVRSLLSEQDIQTDLVLVGNQRDFESALASDKFDIILADYSLPDYTGLQALCAAREKCPATPFLLVSGTIGEHAAIESLKSGATDYVLKQWPDRLVPAVRRAVQEADERAQRRQLEEQLRQAQKMEAIGQLAGGVAHDFNNILMVIHGHASLLLAGGQLSSASARSVQQISQAAERAAALTRQLLSFSRRQLMQPRRLDLNDLVGNVARMLGRILGEDIALQVNYCPQPAAVQADTSMMEQVVLNLAVNARDAMPKGGQLVIGVALVELGAQIPPAHPDARAGRFICLNVADTGSGIAPQHLKHVFEPFFTTKQVGKGTGLGLATVYGIVKQHQGWIEIKSQVGSGTVVKVFLPASEPSQLQPEKPLKKTVIGGAETILVIEDEEPVRQLVCGLLAAGGYKILQAESGVKALQVWNERKDGIDLVLTDLVMPDSMNGRELAERLWSERPNLKVIFTSGYTSDVVGKEFLSRPGLNFLQKPYHPQKLAIAVRECLDSAN